MNITLADLQKRYSIGPVHFSGEQGALYERHLTFDDVVNVADAGTRQRYAAIARSVRDALSQRWIHTDETYGAANPKRVYYLSLEFLIGRALSNNLLNLWLEDLARGTIEHEGIDWAAIVKEEPDAGLGNGGLGRLAACFLDSMATLHLPGMGYGLRYDYGIFRQEIVDGYQVEHPDHWLRYPDPWEVARPNERVEVRLGFGLHLVDGRLRAVPGQTTTLYGIPYDRPIAGYGGETVNTLRLWAAETPDYFDFHDFAEGDLVGALTEKLGAETITRVLYPDDSTEVGKDLRFLQEYFLVACSLADMVRRFRKSNSDWATFADKVAVQMNDTHPALAVSELMRILLDEAGLGWDEAWSITQRTCAYTNHTLLPEALEKWPVALFEGAIPRNLEIIYEINRRFLDEVRARFPGDEGRVARMSLIEDGFPPKVRMAYLQIVGSHSTNGVAAIHSDLLKRTVVRDFAEMYPERFNNKTNGVTPRRWLRMCNPALARVITGAIGDGWVTDLRELERLRPLADDAAFRADFRSAKRAAKASFTDWLKATTGEIVDPDSIFDTQIKRIHEYKRQLLNALHIVVLYNRLRANPDLEFTPRTFFFAGKAAPAYVLAKNIIKFINNLAATINGDPALQGKLQVLFLPDYNCSLAERLIPAGDVSEQISTAGYEASGTSNMKLMLNGALTVGTCDGATIEMAQSAGEENFFLFGLTAEQVLSSQGWYNPFWHYEHEPETRAALDLIRDDHFSRSEPGIFRPILDTLLANGDHYLHLADLQAYQAVQAQVGQLYRDPEAWARKAILNVAGAGPFSSDRTIWQYAREIWGVGPCPVE